jgi:hypothetical protein
MTIRFFPVASPDGDTAGGAGAAAPGAAAAGAAATGGASGGTATGGSGAAAGAGAAGATGGAQSQSGGAQGNSAAQAGAGAGAGAAAAGGDSSSAGGAAAGGGASAQGGAAAGTQAAPSWDADHWRTTWAGADDKKKAWAERRPDIKVALDSAYAADQKIAELSAAAKKVLPENATPEQVAQYRKDNGIPEKPEAYFDGLPAEVKASLDDTAKAILTPYLAKLQELNVSPQVATQLIALRQAEANRWAEDRIAQDAQVRQKTEDALRADWGNNYRAEINNINGLLKGAPQDVQDMFFDARLTDGRGLLANPETLRWLAQLARTVNPYSVPVGGDGGTLDGKGVDQRIAELEVWMGSAKGTDNYRRYYGDPGVQKEYRDLVDARENMRKRSAA